jgi:hypothetical protein
MGMTVGSNQKAVVGLIHSLVDHARSCRGPAPPGRAVGSYGKRPVHDITEESGCCEQSATCATGAGDIFLPGVKEFNSLGLGSLYIACFLTGVKPSSTTPWA